MEKPLLPRRVDHFRSDQNHLGRVVRGGVDLGYLPYNWALHPNRVATFGSLSARVRLRGVGRFGGPAFAVDRPRRLAFQRSLSNEKDHPRDDRAVRAGGCTRIRAADHRQHHRPDPRRPGRGGSGRHRHGAQPADRLRPHGRLRRRRHLPPDVAAGRHLRRHRRAVGVRDLHPQGRHGQRRADDGPQHRAEARRRLRIGQRHGRTADGEDHRLVGRRRRRRDEDREPAAQRPAVREPRGDDPRRRPRLPLRSDQVARSTRRRLPAATAATSTTRSTAATTTTTPSAACCSSSRSRRSRSSTSSPSATRRSTAAATAA